MLQVSLSVAIPILTRPPASGAYTYNGQAAKRPSGQAAKRPSGQAAKRPSGQAAKRPSGQAAKRPSGQAAKRPSGMTCARRLAGARNPASPTSAEHVPISSRGAPRRPDARIGRARARRLSLLPALSLLLGTLALLTPAPAHAQAPTMEFELDTALMAETDTTRRPTPSRCS